MLMINGNAKEFIAGLYYGDERFFTYKGKKYFIQGYYENNMPLLEIYVIKPLGDDFKWRAFLTMKIILLKNLKTQKFLIINLFGKLKTRLNGWIVSSTE